MKNQRLVHRKLGNAYRSAMYAACIIMISALLLVSRPHSVQSAAPATATLTHTPAPTNTIAPATATPLPDPALAQMMDHLVSIDSANVKALQKIYQWTAHSDPVTSLVFVSPNNQLVSNAQNQTNRLRIIRVWNITSGNINPIRIKLFQNMATGGVRNPQVQLSENARILTTAQGWLLDIRTWQLVGDLHTYATTVFQYGDNHSISGGSDGLVSIWRFDVPAKGYRDSGILPDNYNFYDTPIYLETAFRIEGEIVQVAHADNISFILSRNGKLVTYMNQAAGAEIITSITVPLSYGAVKPLAEVGNLMVLQPNKQRVIYAGPNREVIVYDYKNQQIQRSIGIGFTASDMSAEIGCLAIHPDRQILFIGYASGELRFLNLDAEWPDPAVVGQIQTDQPVTACTFNADGSMLVTGDATGQLALWGVTS